MPASHVARFVCFFWPTGFFLLVFSEQRGNNMDDYVRNTFNFRRQQIDV